MAIESKTHRNTVPADVHPVRRLGPSSAFDRKGGDGQKRPFAIGDHPR